MIEVAEILLKLGAAWLLAYGSVRLGMYLGEHS